MRLIPASLLIFVFWSSAAAQPETEALAAIGGRTITVQDLEPQFAKAWNELPQKLRETRNKLLEQQIERKILELEAASREISVEELVNSEVTAKVGEPKDVEIQKVFEDNLAEMGGATLSQVRPQIVRFLKQEAEREAYAKFIAALRGSYTVEMGKDPNADDLRPFETLAKVGGNAITHADYVKRNGLALYELEANTVDAVLSALTQIVDAAVYTSEAESLGIATSDLIAREITDKMRDYTDSERERLEEALNERLYAKYRVLFFVKEPEPYVQAVSADDDPFLGRANAPVTVVMFTDYQCPACGGVDPVLKRIVTEFGASVRLVVRDFPLIGVHENAFDAAVAAGAALKQGKFFEYSEVLYNNQDSLDAASLKRFAAEAGLNVDRFERDLRDEEIKEEIRKDIADGKSYGATGTPSIYVNGYKIRTLSAPAFRKAIRRALAK